MRRVDLTQRPAARRARGESGPAKRHVSFPIPPYARAMIDTHLSARLLDVLCRIHRRPALPLLVPVADAFVAGLRFYAGLFLRDKLRPGDALVLRRQRDNPHDPLAVEVLTADGRRLGYVPRVVNARVAALLDDGAALSATVTAVHPTAPPQVGLRFLISTPGTDTRQARVA